MNTENNNVFGVDSFNPQQPQTNNEPQNNIGEETFSPFQDLNNTPLNVPTDNIEVNQAEQSFTDTLVEEPTFSQPTDFIQNPVPQEPVESIEPIAPQVEPTVSSYNEPIVEQPAQEQTYEPFTPTQSAPTMENYDNTPIVEPVQTEPVTQNINVESTPMPVVEDINVNPVQNDVSTETVAINNINQGPTMPIPDQMPTTDYQSGVSTPVDYATPMSDFDQIGTTPELDPRVKGKKGGKGLLVLLLLIIILGLGAGSYYLINIKGIFNSENVVLKQVVSEKGEALSVNINDYATFKNTSSSNCSLNTNEVDVTKEGEYSFTITCGDKSYKGKLTIKDTKAPNINVKTNVILAGTMIEAQSLVISSDEEATYAYASDTEKEAYQTAGLKNINVVATDKNNNSKTYSVPVIVTSYEYSFGIVAEKNLTEDESKEKVIEKNVILYSDIAGMTNDTSYTAYIIKFATSQIYKDAIKNYSGSGQFTYGNYIGTPLFYVDDNTLVLIKDINTDLIKENYQYTYESLNGNNGYQIFSINKNNDSSKLVQFNEI